MAGWFTGCKVDAVAFSSLGVYSAYYGAGEEGNLANLYSSLGLIEDAPDIGAAVVLIFGLYRCGIGTEIG